MKTRVYGFELIQLYMYKHSGQTREIDFEQIIGYSSNTSSVGNMGRSYIYTHIYIHPYGSWWPLRGEERSRIIQNRQSGRLWK